MRVPERLEPLVDQGVIDEVIRPLMSGKEAAVYLVMSEGEQRVAKVYKEAAHRSFKQRTEYVEGRKTRNSRDQRAIQKKSGFGQERIEAAWRSAEVDYIYRLREAGVRVPEPHAYVDGVLVMELVKDEHGEPAPRLVDFTFTPEQARETFDVLLREVVKMLCAGVVHGDLSDFNVLIGPNGPVIIDLPQAVDPAHNNNARKLLIRDVKNLTSFLARYDDSLKGTRFGDEMWALYEKNELTPQTKLTGRFKGSERKADTSSLLMEIEAAEREARKRREALGLPPPRPARKVPPTPPAPQPLAQRPGGPKAGGPRPVGPRPEGPRAVAPPQPGPGEGKRKRRRKKWPSAAPIDPLDALLMIED